MRLVPLLVMLTAVLAGQSHYFSSYYDQVDVPQLLAKRSSSIHDYGNVINYVDMSNDDIDRIPLANDWYRLVIDNGPANSEILNDYERENGIENAVKFFNDTKWQKNYNCVKSRKRQLAKRGWKAGQGTNRVCCSNINKAQDYNCNKIVNSLKDDATPYCNISFYYLDCIVRAGSSGCLGGQWIRRNANKVISQCYSGPGLSGYAFPQDSGDKKICVSQNNHCTSVLSCA